MGKFARDDLVEQRDVGAVDELAHMADRSRAADHVAHRDAGHPQLDRKAPDDEEILVFLRQMNEGFSPSVSEIFDSSTMTQLHASR